MAAADDLVGGVRFCSASLFCSVLILLLTRKALAFSSHEMNFFQMSECGVNKVLKPENRYKKVKALTPLNCALVCSSDVSCKSFDYDNGRNLCYLGSVRVSHKNCGDLVQPAVSDGTLHFASVDQCSDGKELHPDKTCQCPKGFGQEGCLTKMQDCSDYTGYLDKEKDSVVWIWPNNTDTPFQVLCNEVGSGKLRTVLMMNQQDDSSLSIFKMAGWEDYKNGFGSFTGSHWLGLEHMHLLTTNSQRKHKLRFALTTDTDGNTDTVYKTFNGHVGDEGSQYAINIDKTDSSNSDFADCLYRDVNGIPFSTWDRNDSNCSVVFGGGFWFNASASCALCNPTGRIMLPPYNGTVRPPDAAFWNNTRNAQISHILFYLLTLKP